MSRGPYLTYVIASSLCLVLSGAGLGQPVGGEFRVNTQNAPPPVVGYWNDGRVGENTGLTVNIDGTGEYVSDLFFPFDWQYDPTMSVMMITPMVIENGLKHKDAHTKGFMFRYVAGSDSIRPMGFKRKGYLLHRVASERGLFHRGK
jgi:hypothetical protein